MSWPRSTTRSAASESQTASGEPASPADDPADDVRWLTDEEELSWRALMALMVKLPWALECQMQRDADVSVVEYHVLAMLSERPGHAMRMSELSELTNASLSRLSHLFKRLEARGLVRREPDQRDGRYTLAILSDDGYRHLVASAPAHVREVRRLVMDALTPQQLGLLGTIAGRLLEQLHGDGVPRDRTACVNHAD